MSEELGAEASERQEFAAILDSAPEPEVYDEPVSEEPQLSVVPETDDATDEVAAVEALTGGEDVGTAIEEGEPETDDLPESESLDFEQMLSDGVTITIEGQTHKIGDVIKYYRDVQVEKQQLSEDKKAFESQREEVDNKLSERDKILSRLQTDNIGLAVDAIAVTDKALAQELLRLAQQRTSYDPKDAENKRLSQELEQRKADDSAKDEQAQAQEQEHNARISLEASISKEITDEEWEDVKAAVPLALRKNKDSQTPLTDAWNILNPEPAKLTKRKPPRNERPRGATKRPTGLSSKDRSELAQLLA